MDESQNQYVKRNKSDTKGYIQYVKYKLTYSDKKQTHDGLCQTQVVKFRYNGIDGWFLSSALIFVFCQIGSLLMKGEHVGKGQARTLEATCLVKRELEMRRSPVFLQTQSP